MENDKSKTAEDVHVVPSEDVETQVSLPTDSSFAKRMLSPQAGGKVSNPQILLSAISNLNWKWYLVPILLICILTVFSLNNNDDFRFWLLETAQEHKLIDPRYLKEAAIQAWKQRKVRLGYNLYKLYYFAIEKQGQKSEQCITLYGLSFQSIFCEPTRAAWFAQELAKKQLEFRGPRDPRLAEAYLRKSAAEANNGQFQLSRISARKAARIVFIACDPGSRYYAYLNQLFTTKSSSSKTSPPDVLSISRHPNDWHAAVATDGPPDPESIVLWKALRSELGIEEASFDELDHRIVERYQSHGLTSVAREYEKKYAQDSAYQSVIALFSAHYGADSPRLATMMNDFACSLRSRGRVKEAIEWERKVDFIRSKQPKPAWLDESVVLDKPDSILPEK